MVPTIETFERGASNYDDIDEGGGGRRKVMRGPPPVSAHVNLVNDN